jgi:phytoene synthase
VGKEELMIREQALAYCARLTRRHSSTFYLGSRLFLGKKREAVSVIYAVCRSGDDAVDKAANRAEGKRRLDLWWSHIDRAYQQIPRSDEPLEIGLAWVLEHYPVPKSALEELRCGLESDLKGLAVATMDDLLLYCRRVAGVVGLLVTPITGYRGGEDTLHCAVALGQAMQLTNILRDVGEDLELGRCYLPQELLCKYDVSLSDLRSGIVASNYVELFEELADVAHDLYRLAWKGIPRLHGSAGTAVGVAALNYEAILRKVRQNRYDNLTKRAYLRPLERIVLIPRAVAGVYGGARLSVRLAE